MKKIMVTGGAGFVGSCLTNELVIQNYEVVCVDNLRYGYNPIISQLANYPNFKFDCIDLCQDFNIPAWKRIESYVEEADCVIHLASLVGYPACEKDPDYATRLNVSVAKHLADLCKKYDTKLLYASTGSVYGKLDGICDEKAVLNPLTHYARTKYQAEQYIVNHCKGLAFRFATAFGLSPRLRLDLYINDMVYRALFDGSVVAYEPGNRRTFIYVTDMARLFLHALTEMESLEGVYNAGDEKHNLTKMQILEKIKTHLPHFYIAYGEYQEDKDKRDYNVSYKKLMDTGFHCKIGIDEGIQTLIDYLKLMDFKQVGFTILNNIK